LGKQERVMLAWQVPYLGWRHFPAELSEFEISRFFTFEPEVHRAIRSRYKDTLRLGVALQLGFLTMCGRTLHAFQRVPAELLKHLGEQMEIPVPDIATLRALYKNRRATLFEHQAWSIEFLGFLRFEMTDAPKILPAIRDVVKAGVNGDPLLASARRLLHEYRFVIPGTRRLGSLVQLAVQSVEREVLTEIDRKIPRHIRTQWLDATRQKFPSIGRRRFLSLRSLRGILPLANFLTTSR
jgi:hypothetical protein